MIAIDQLAEKRRQFCIKRLPLAPSTDGRPAEFISTQRKVATQIPCNRPFGAPMPVPLPLLHPVFGQFIQNSREIAPTPNDVKLVRALVEAMANIYVVEDDRRYMIWDVFDEGNIPIVESSMDAFHADGDIVKHGFRSLIAGFIDEIGSSGPEPSFQATLQYFEATRQKAIAHTYSVLPCIILLFFGPYIAFAGAAWTDQPNIQMLSPAIPCHYHPTDVSTELSLVRHLSALRIAVASLQQYYQNISQSHSSRDPRFPYPTSFTDRNGTVQSFAIKERTPDYLPYFGTIDGLRDDNAICIKFVTRYCLEAHELLASKGLAPELLAVEHLPGGWYMVVMRDLRADYVNLYDFCSDKPDWTLEPKHNARDLLSSKIEDCLKQLHRAGFVHGDVRHGNILVKTTGFDDGSFVMVDFDFAGKIGEVRYPLDLNVTSVRRLR
ncbi:hypothetical protein BDN70DRAFT_819476 [Pholiota conissans]|uniref:ABC1 atypical kinase-like domain-containing protein n=1 Tax=Pholiota conissans TaxID=109636 RepID=A0A9P5YQI8_9AGAR|nr:hypothetical protein BDN70DRAFT_819476 [Pholiota conissans]